MSPALWEQYLEWLYACFPNQAYRKSEKRSVAWCAKHQASEPVRATHNLKPPALPGNTYLPLSPNALENSFNTALLD